MTAYLTRFSTLTVIGLRICRSSEQRRSPAAVSQNAGIRFTTQPFFLTEARGPRNAGFLLFGWIPRAFSDEKRDGRGPIRLPLAVVSFLTPGSGHPMALAEP